MEFKVLTSAGHFVDENLLGKGIYITSKPTLRGSDETMESVEDQFRKVFELSPTFFHNPEVIVKNLKKCLLTEVTLTIK